MDNSLLERQLTDAYDSFADDIFRHCYFRTSNREKALELMQDSFTKTWEYMIAGGDIDNIKSFLYRTANNMIIDHYRRKSKRTETSLESMQEIGFEVVGVEDTTESTKHMFTQQQVVEILGQLKEPYRTAVVMRYIDELSPKEIAQTLDENVNKISVRINRGLKMLQSLLPSNG